MKRAHTFDLERAVAAWRRRFAYHRVFLAEDLDELERHLRDHVAELEAEGRPAETAFHDALRALGDFPEAEDEYRKVYWGKLKRRRQRLRETIWRLAMLRNYLKIALRSLRKHKAYAFINISGLAVGLACCLLIFLLVRHEWSFDRFHAEAGRIYRVLIQETKPDGSLDYSLLIPPATTPEMIASFPSIERATRVVGGTLGIRRGDEVFHESLYMVDSSFFQVFSFPLLAGDPASALRDPRGIVLTEELARKHFGETEDLAGILGKPVEIEYGDDVHAFTVTGVAAELPKNSSLRFDFLLSFEQYEPMRIGANDWGGRTSLYLLMPDAGAAAALEASLPPFTETQFADRIERRRQMEYLAQGEDAFRLVLQPFSEMHLTPEIGTPYEASPHDPTYSYILGGIGLLVLLIACVNFMTLSIGRSSTRAREVGMRKVLGAHRGQLMRQFWGEALVLTAVALVLGLTLAALLLPTFNALTGQELSLLDVEAGSGLLLLVGLTGLVGFVAGGYPAAVLSRFQPARVLKGEVAAGGRRRFTQSLVVLQYTIAIGLMICMAVMYQQLDYLLHRDLGFEGEQVAVVHTSGLSRSQGRQVLEVFRNEVAQDPRVSGIAAAGYSFTRSYDTRSWTAADGASRRAHMLGVDHTYLDVLGMELAAGRNFSVDLPTDSTESVLVNEAYVREYGIEEPVGHRISGFGGFFEDVDPVIVGVVKDFNFQSLHQEVEPAVLNIHPDYYVPMQAILVRLSPDDLTGGVDLLERTWGRVMPEQAFSFSFLDDDMDAQYEAERRWSRIVTYASLLAFLIAGMGLFGLATLSTARRTKEIGVRKVLGASVSGIAVLVSREFAVLVGVAALVAWPLAYLGMDRWLGDFAYRVEMPWYVFPAATAAALVLALATVGYQTWRAASTDPVRALRYE